MMVFFMADELTDDTDRRGPIPASMLDAFA